MAVKEASAPTLTASRLIAAEIRAELARRGFTSRQFALQHGLNEMWLNRRIGRKASIDMTFEEVDQLAGMLDVDVQVLLAPWFKHGANAVLPRLDSNQQPFG